MSGGCCGGRLCGSLAFGQMSIGFVELHEIFEYLSDQFARVVGRRRHFFILFSDHHLAVASAANATDRAHIAYQRGLHRATTVVGGGGDGGGSLSGELNGGRRVERRIGCRGRVVTGGDVARIRRRRITAAAA